MQDLTSDAATVTTRLPAGVLDLVANSCRNVAQIQAAAGGGAVQVARDDDTLTGLLALARSVTAVGLEAATPDDSLIELGLDSLQIVMLLGEAARMYCPDKAPFDMGLDDFLARPTLRELASTLSRLAEPIQA
jgi:aryl carrier-like protein